ncbi:MAG TPA: DUF4190 domain-containing protein [Ktedonobacterales bacterium]|nr:DUF4190 domain-containing protein [Ktedonobacterales bacterium]
MQPIRPVAPVPPYDPGPMPPRTTGFALFGIGAVALGLGLIQLSVLLPFVTAIGFLCGVAAVVLGLIALLQIARDPKRLEGRRMAVAAIVLGTLEALGYLVFFLVPRGLPFGL